MAKIALKLDEMIDGDALRRDLALLAPETGAGASTPELRQAVVGLLKGRLAAGRLKAEEMLLAREEPTVPAKRAGLDQTLPCPEYQPNVLP